MNHWTLRLLLLSLVLILATSTSKYKVVSADHTTSSVTLKLQYTGSDQYYVKPTSPIIKNLTVKLTVYSYTDFSLKITDSNKQRFEVPQEGVFPIDPLKNFTFPLNLSAIRFEYTESPFDFRLSRKFNNATLFSTYNIEFIYSDYYLQIGTELDTEYTYGVGERHHRKFRLVDGKWTVFNRDRWQIIDDGKGLQTYGYYPIYLQREVEKYFHMNYLRSSNAMDVIRETKDGKAYLTYKVIGGILDFRFFLGEQSPEGTVNKLHIYMGRSTVPPFWALGFHQSRWGYRNITALQDVLKGYKDNDIPLDTIWSDIDYMLDYEDFTIDQSRFPLDQMKEITDNYHYVPIIDAGIKVDGIAYTQGKERGVFIKDANGEQYRAILWPGNTTFVDFFHPNATQYWKEMLQILYNKVKFSGIWLDMNEYSTFCEGPCQPPIGQSKFDYSNDIPYTPGCDSIENFSISLNATHYGGLKQADVRIFAAFLQTYATNSFLKSKNMRPFILSRSHTLGSNKFGFHWTGDNHASFEFLKSSIIDIFVNQMWGFQIIGAEICGFGGDTTQELCSRWFQLGSLYPFARDHNDVDSKGQEPYALGDTVLQAAKTNIKLRYSLLKHMYSIIVNRRGLGTIFTPLFYQFPFDNNLYVDEISDTQFLIGNNLLAAPILEQGQTSRSVYFPFTNWYNLHDGTLYKNGTAVIENVKLTDKVPLFLREGTMILMQNTDNVRNTKDLDNVFHLVAAFRKDTRRSNDTYHVYESAGVHISIGDYNDETKLEFCLLEGCDYEFNLLLTSAQNTRTLQITTSYGGGFRLNDTIIFNQVTAHYDGISVHNSLANQIEIKAGTKVTIPLNDKAVVSGNLKKQELMEE